MREGNKTAYFSFYGNSTNNDLAYYILNDEYYKKTALQTFYFKIFNNDLNEYDLRCKMVLSP